MRESPQSLHSIQQKRHTDEQANTPSNCSADAWLGSKLAITSNSKGTGQASYQWGIPEWFGEENIQTVPEVWEKQREEHDMDIHDQSWGLRRRGVCEAERSRHRPARPDHELVVPHANELLVSSRSATNQLQNSLSPSELGAVYTWRHDIVIP